MTLIDNRLTPEQKQERLQQVSEWAIAVAEHFHPQKVILFGSYAYGAPTTDSDLDVLVVMPTDLEPSEQAALIRRSVRLRSSMDLLVRTPEQLAERVRLGDFFLREVVGEGLVLYESADN